jgi:hypothetical protein
MIATITATNKNMKKRNKNATTTTLILVIILLLTLLQTSVTAQQFKGKNIYVSSTQGVPALECGSTVQPCATVAAALLHVSEYDTILIDDGVYTGTGNSNLTLSITGITIRSINGATKTMFTGATETIFFIDECQSCTVDGFTFQYNTADNGAAVRILNSVDITVTNIVAMNNHVHLAGGAVYMKYSNVTISNSLFSNNTVTVLAHAALYNSDESLFGGASIYGAFVQLVLSNVILSFHSSVSVTIWKPGSVILNSCIFEKNIAITGLSCKC